jgi:hypothetical protein
MLLLSARKIVGDRNRRPSTCQDDVEASIRNPSHRQMLHTKATHLLPESKSRPEISIGGLVSATTWETRHHPSIPPSRTSSLEHDIFSRRSERGRLWALRGLNSERVSWARFCVAGGVMVKKVAVPDSSDEASVIMRLPGGVRIRGVQSRG